MIFMKTTNNNAYHNQKSKKQHTSNNNVNYKAEYKAWCCTDLHINI